MSRRDPPTPEKEIDGPTQAMPPGADSPRIRDRAGEQRGDLIGPYRLLEALGEGGFGTVWLAERREPFVQRVALKIIKAGMDTKAVIARFEQERQALAVMDHPNVAKVHDAGMTLGGRPYFVMEHVAGESITTYCDKHRLTLRQRLELFIPVCEAVQHAHHKGIIHRDLKPSNILVSVREEKGIPKVIDFGVAKAMSHTLTDKTIFTESGQLIGTPEYMSPEQAEMRGGDVDTRSDVYSLGAVLYELLAGEVPFESKALRSAGYDGIRRVIREVAPPKPSTRLTSLQAETSAAIADHRRIDRGELRSALKRELDWIPLKALRKDRTERYGSPADLARDIRNYLEGKPLEAGPESASYRFRKLVRRNKGAFIACAAVTVALLMGVISFAWQAHRLGIERNAAILSRNGAEEARSAEEKARRRSDAIRQFLETALKGSNPYDGGKEGIQADELMFKSVAQIDNGAFKDQPEIEASLLMTIADVLVGNGRPNDALPLSERALAIYQRLHATDHREVADTLENMANTLRTLGRWKEAETVCLRAVQMNQRLASGDDLMLAQSLDSLGTIRVVLGRWAQAESDLDQSLKMRRRLLKGDDPILAQGMNNLATTLSQQGRATEAEALYSQAVEMEKRIHTGDDPNTAACLGNLAYIRIELGRAAEAEVLARQSLEMNQRLFKRDQPAVASSLGYLAEVLLLMGRIDEAEPLYLESLEMNKRLFRGDHPTVAYILMKIAHLRVVQKRADDAVPFIEQSVAMFHHIFPDGHPDLAEALSVQASVCNAQQKWPEAERLSLESLRMYQRIQKGDSRRTMMALSNLAITLQNLGRFAEAEPPFLQALEMAQRLFKGDNAYTATYLNDLANVRSWQNRPEEAEPLLLQALEMRQRLVKGDDAATALSLSNLASVRMALGHPMEAKKLSEQAVAMAEKVMPQDDNHVKGFRAILAAASMACVSHATPAFWFNYTGNEAHFWTHPDPDHWQEAYPDGKVTSFLVKSELKGEVAGSVVRRIPDDGFEVLIPPLRQLEPLRYRSSPTGEWRRLGSIYVIK